MAPDFAFNTAMSFVTNTNWQAYSGEAALSYFSQMVGLTVQNFVSAATGMAVAVAVARGFAARAADGIGNFWVDVTRSVLYVLLPLSVLLAVALVVTGVPQSLAPYSYATTLEGADQLIAQGPVASQVAIKQLGTNGGGFFGINSAHPLENPTIVSNLLQCVSILLIPVAFVFLFGRMVGDCRQGVALFAAMGVLFLTGLAVIYAGEAGGNPLLSALPIDQAAGNMEGKEVRFGAGLSALWSEATTAASNGSVNAMHDSFMPLPGLALMLNMQSGEVIFGGVGVGLYGMLLFVVLAVFLAGLMVGRTPEYLGKKIEAREVKLAVLAFLSMPLGILVFGALAATVPAALAAVQDPGPHGLSEILYAYSSATGNNGSAFAGFGAALPFHTTLQGIAMQLGRFAFIVPMLAIAGSLAAKTPAPPTAGTFPTNGPLFVVLLIATLVILGALTFFPVLALGPIAEAVSLSAGQTF
jgi:K+-transporting ATPase ATPase A chain